MADKLIKTRMLQKIDSAANWNANDPVLKNGEIAVVLLSAEEAEVFNGVKKPLVLFKVGDGEKSYKNLDWVSGKAADVYDWAKAASKPSYGISDIENLEAALNNKQNKVSAIVLTAENGTLSAEQLAAIKAESSTKIIVNNDIFKLSVKDTIDNKYIYSAFKSLAGVDINNAKLELNLVSGGYQVSIFKTADVAALETKTDTIEQNVGSLSSTMTSHIDNKDSHIQPGEREKWNNKVTCNVINGVGGDFTLELKK